MLRRLQLSVLVMLVCIAAHGSSNPFDNNGDYSVDYVCSDGSLILLNDFCDGKSDCSDDYDERSCSGLSTEDSSNQASVATDIPTVSASSQTTEVVPDSSTYDEATDTTLSPSIRQTLANPVIEEVEQELFSMNGTVMIFIFKLNMMLYEMQQEKAKFLENMEDENVTMIFRMFNRTECNDTSTSPPQYETLKKSFTLRFGLLEISLREAMAELEDKLRELLRQSELESKMADVKLKACELFDLGSFCENITLQVPCLADDCLPSEQSVDSLIFKLGKSERQVFRMKLVRKGPLSTECEDGSFRCQNGLCITQNMVCNNANNCQDNSDETTSYCRGWCPEKRCRNLQCVYDYQICDGIDDCGDGTDEENCATVKVPETFTCTDGSENVPLNVTCDGKPDCSDSSDEGGSCYVTDGCGRCVVMGGACLRSPEGPLCLSSCPSGFLFHFQSGLCIIRDSTLGKRIDYENYSFFGIMKKIKSLFNRLSNGLILMKRELNQEIIKSLTNLKACIKQ